MFTLPTSSNDFFSTPTRSSHAAMQYSPQSPKLMAGITIASRGEERTLTYDIADAIDPEIFKVEFELASRRIKTQYGLAQASHTTPYICILQLICNMIEDYPLEEALKNILNIAKIFTPTKIISFNKIINEIKSNFLSRDERKEITQGIRASEDLVADVGILMQDARFVDLCNEKQICIQNMQTNINLVSKMSGKVEPTKAGLKLGEKSNICQLMQKMVDLFIKTLNTDENMSFLKNGELLNEEGAKVKYSRYALNSLNILLGLKHSSSLKIYGNINSDITTQEIIFNLSDEEVSNFYNLILEKNSQFKTGLKRLFDIKLESNEEKELDRLLRQNSFNMELMIKFIFEKLEQIDIAKKASNLIISLFDFSFKDREKEEDIFNRLPIVVARHLAIMDQIFPHISADSKLKQKIQMDFLQRGVLKEGNLGEENLEGGGWEKLTIIVKKRNRSAERFLDIDHLIEKINYLKTYSKYTALINCLDLNMNIQQESQFGKKRKGLDVEEKKQLDLQDKKDNLNEKKQKSSDTLSNTPLKKERKIGAPSPSCKLPTGICTRRRSEISNTHN
jgi:hypothetical protein